VGSDIDLDGYDDMPAEENKRLRAGYKGSYGIREKIDIEGVDHPKRIFDLTEGLIRRKYTDREIELALGGDFQTRVGANLVCLTITRLAMKWNRRLCLFALFLASAIAAARPGQDRDVTLTVDELAQGKRIYVGQCALCHGIEGVGGRGPALNQPALRRAKDDVALYNVIKNGVAGTEMPAAWHMTEREVWRVVGYIHYLNRAEDVKLTGDAGRGRELYRAKGCAGCHIVRGEGGGERALVGDKAYGAVRALDVATGKMKWEFRLQSPPWACVLATAGGVVFSRSNEGNFFALDEATGEPLWDFQIGGAIEANPISFLNDGRQHVAIAAGQALFVFGLHSAGSRQ
jgi:mono/diheme cytochrome c family protein